MGEISEMMMEGVLCQECGAFVGEDKIKANGGEVVGDEIRKVPGFPLSCGDCKRAEKRRKYGKPAKQAGFR